MKIPNTKVSKLNLIYSVWILVLVFSNTVFGASGHAPLPKSKTELKKICTPACDEDPGRISDVLEALSSTKRFQLEGASKQSFVEFILSGRFEPDAPVPNNLVAIIDSKNLTSFYLLPSITVEDIKMVSKNTFQISGSGGYFYEGGKCGWSSLNRTYLIRLVKKQKGFVPVLEKSWDSESCSK